MKSKEQNAKLERPTTWARMMTWVGGATALIGLFASVGSWYSRIEQRRATAAEYQQKMALGAVQAEQGRYEASLQTYGEILKQSPNYEPAFTMQLKTAELWAEKINVKMAAEAGLAMSAAARLKTGGNTEASQEDDEAVGGFRWTEDTDVAAAAMLDQIMPVLEDGLTRTKGTDAADARAFVGWVHWLNHQVAERESKTAYEPNERAALAMDPGNVYANAMLGHAMLVNAEDLPEAMRHFEVALAGGRDTGFIRTLEIEGLYGLKERGGRGQLVKVANDAQSRSAHRRFHAMEHRRLLLQSGADQP